MSVRARCGGLLAAALLLIPAGCSSGRPRDGAAPQGEVRIGLLVPLTGAGEPMGTEYRRGAELAAEVVNAGAPELPLAAGGGLAGPSSPRLVLAPRDTASSPNEAETQADELMSGGALAVVAADSDDVVHAVSLRAERARVPLVDAGTASLRLTDAGLDWYFRTAPSDRLLAEALLTTLTADGTAPRIAVARPSGERLGEAVGALEDLAAEAGAQIVARSTFDGSARSISSAAAALTRAGPTVTVVLAATTTEAAAMVHALRSRAPRTAIAGLGPGFAGAAFLTAAGRSAAGVLRAEPWSAGFAERNEVARRLADRYQQRFHAPMSAAAADGFTAVLTVAAAIRASGARTPAAVRAALFSADVPGAELPMPWAGVRFERGGQNAAARGIVEQIRDGRPTVVSPPELADARPQL